MSKKDNYKLTEQDAVEILADTLRILREAGVQIGIRNAPAKEGRPAGLMVFAGNVELNNGGLVYKLPQKVEQE